jgi:DnaJ like chaperone protein
MGQFILFLIVGVVFAYIFRSYNTKQYSQIQTDKKERFNGDLNNHEAGMLVALMAKVAKADGGVCELEAEMISNTLSDISSHFENNQEVRDELKKIYEKEKQSFDNLVDICQKYKKLTNNHYDSKLRTFIYLVNLAFIDGDFSDAEKMIIEDIANNLEIKQKDFVAIIDRFSNMYQDIQSNHQNSLDEAYKIIGVSPDDDDKTIKNVYRKLVKQNHPDIIKGRGGDDSDIQKATQKLQEINGAYETIKKDRGI